jgi:hypothetical protein
VRAIWQAAHRFSAIRMRSLIDPRQGSLPTALLHLESGANGFRRSGADRETRRRRGTCIRCKPSHPSPSAHEFRLLLNGLAHIWAETDVLQLAAAAGTFDVVAGGRGRSIGGTMRRRFSPISQERSARKRQRRRRANRVPQSAPAHRRPALLPGRSTGRRRPKGRARSPRCEFDCNRSIPSGAKEGTPCK